MHEFIILYTVYSHGQARLKPKNYPKSEIEIFRSFLSNTIAVTSLQHYTTRIIKISIIDLIFKGF